MLHQYEHPFKFSQFHNNLFCYPKLYRENMVSKFDSQLSNFNYFDKVLSIYWKA